MNLEIKVVGVMLFYFAIWVVYLRDKEGPLWLDILAVLSTILSFVLLIS